MNRPLIQYIYLSAIKSNWSIFFFSFFARFNCFFNISFTHSIPAYSYLQSWISNNCLSQSMHIVDGSKQDWNSNTSNIKQPKKKKHFSCLKFDKMDNSLMSVGGRDRRRPRTLMLWGETVKGVVWHFESEWEYENKMRIRWEIYIRFMTKVKWEDGYQSRVCRSQLAWLNIKTVKVFERWARLCPEVTISAYQHLYSSLIDTSIHTSH